MKEIIILFVTIISSLLIFALLIIAMEPSIVFQPKNLEKLNITPKVDDVYYIEFINFIEGTRGGAVCRWDKVKVTHISKEGVITYIRISNNTRYNLPIDKFRKEARIKEGRTVIA